MIAVVSVGATSTLAVEPRPKADRARLILANNSNEDMYACPGAVAIATAGLPIKANGGSVTDEPDAQGKMYQGIWTAICASGSKLLSITELYKDEIR